MMTRINPMLHLPYLCFAPDRWAIGHACRDELRSLSQRRPERRANFWAPAESARGSRYWSLPALHRPIAADNGLHHCRATSSAGVRMHEFHDGEIARC